MPAYEALDCFEESWMNMKGCLDKTSRAMTSRSRHLNASSHACLDPSLVRSDAARLRVAQRILQCCGTARTASRQTAGTSDCSPACFESPNAQGNAVMDLSSQMRAVEDLPAVWTPTASPHLSSFLHDLISLPKQYVPVFDQPQWHQAERLMDVPDMDYPISQVDQYGPAGAGISPELKLLLRDALRSPQQSSAASTSVARDTAAQPSGTAAALPFKPSGTLADALHLEAALLNVALDVTEAITSSGPPIAAARTPSAVAQVQSRGQTRILVVDDDQDVGRVTSAFLRKAGFEVITVGNGNEGLAALSADPGIDTLVTDYAMVGTNGVELVLQARELRAGLKALVITGYVGAEVLERLPEDVAVLRKPFQRENFIRQVIGLVEGTTPLNSVEQKHLESSASALNALARS